jgi:hypothetical protein
MKKFTVLLSIVVLILFFIAGSSHCQTTTDKNKPFFTIDVSGGLNIPLLDLKGTGPLGFYNFQDYGVGLGPSTAINVKMAVLTRKMLQLRLYAIFGYAHFSNDGAGGIDLGAAPVGWPPQTKTYSYLNGGTSYIRINQPYTGLGFEYAQYTDRDAKSSFNFGLDIVLSMITGRAYQTTASGVEEFNTLRANPRLGFGFNLFWNYRISNIVGINVGSRFQFSNIIGKSSYSTDESGYVYLNDEANQSLNVNLSNNRNVAFMSFFGGMSFYIGKK